MLESHDLPVISFVILKKFPDVSELQFHHLHIGSNNSKKKKKLEFNVLIFAKLLEQCHV